MNAPTKKGSGLGLDSLSDLSQLMNKPVSKVHTPLEIDLDKIDPDPEQPRTYFDEVKLNELAQTIKNRCVKKPISVKANKEQPGRYIINDGERRWRASKIAEKKTIPAFIDEDFIPDDQAIANIQQEGFTAIEIANLIQKRLQTGKKKGEIAKALGKSNAWVSQYAALNELPEPIDSAFKGGRCEDVTVINELVKLYKTDPDEVNSLLDDDTRELSRGSVAELKEFLTEKHGSKEEADVKDEEREDESAKAKKEKKGKAEKTESGAPEKDKFKTSVVSVEYDGRPGQLMLTKRPPAPGFAWVKFKEDGDEVEADLTKVKLVELVSA